MVRIDDGRMAVFLNGTREFYLQVKDNGSVSKASLPGGKGKLIDVFKLLDDVWLM